VSELLQSQLLQPNNITPIQPRLAESNLFLVSSQGAANLSFNEFNPIFNRDRLALQASGLVGENDTYAGEVVASGIYKKVSFSVGYTHFETDGWRDNADQDDDIVNAFLQLELTYRTSIQAEYRYRDTDQGETRLRFFEDDFRPNLDQETETNTFRLGFRHSFSPGSDLIGNFSYFDGDDKEKDEPLDPSITFIDGKADRDTYGGELQYLFRSQYINFVSGAGHVDIDGKDKIDSEALVPLPPPLPPILVPVPIEIRVDRDAKHTNLYTYTYLNLVDNLTLTVGGSGDFFDADDEDTKDRDQFNPKFGVTWNPFPDTTIRGAAFRVLKRSLVTDQTLEPTQVAGFNQFYDDFNATDAWRYGGAVDQKITDNIYGGAEYTYRDLSVPFFDTIRGSERTVKWDEKIFRTYLFWTPSDWLALRAEWLWERFQRNEDFSDGARLVETNYVPLGFNFFHPSGLSASFTGTYVDQQGSFERITAARTFENGDDQFWLVDAAIRYRFPKRYGFFTVGVSNLSDEDFEHFDTDQDNARIQPDRVFFASITLALP
jgi:opacity protein-like surface antigen